MNDYPTLTHASEMTMTRTRLFALTALLAPLPVIARSVRELIRAGRKARGHVLNLGHGVLQTTPVEAVATFVRTAQEAGG